jgi:hypothetical protein
MVDKGGFVDKISLIVLVLAITVLGCLRDGIGTDWNNYVKLFNHPVGVEWGFKSMANFVKGIGGGFYLFSILFFLLAFMLKYLFFVKLSPSVALSLLIYSGFWFLVYDLNGIRQGMALGFTGLAFFFAYKRNLLKYCLCIALAILNHRTALMFLPFYFLVNISINRLYLSIGVGVFFIAAIFNVTDMMLEALRWVLGSTNTLSVKLHEYQMNSLYNSNILFSFTTLHRVFIFFIILAGSRFFMLEEKLVNTLVIVAFLNIVLYLLLCRYEIIAARLTLYYRFPECISFAALPFVFKRKQNQIVIAFLLLLYIMGQVYSTLSIPNGGLLPYKILLFNL